MNYGVSFSMTDLEGVGKSEDNNEGAPSPSSQLVVTSEIESPSPLPPNACRPKEEEKSSDREAAKEPVHHYLFPEEALYLHMLGLVVVLGGEKGDEAMTTKDLYLRYFSADSCVDYGIALPAYLAYMHLRAQSYIVARHGLLYSGEGQKEENAPTDAGDCAEDKLRMERTRKKKNRLKRIDRALQHPPIQINSNEVSLAFDVYKPNSSFRKSDPGPPDFCVAVGNFNSPSPPLSMLLSLISECNGTPLRVAVISDSGTVMLFSFSDEEAPVIIDRQERQRKV